MKKIKENLLFILIVIEPILDVIAYFALDTKFFIIAFGIRSLILLFTTIYCLKNYHSKKYWLFLGVLAFLAVVHLGTTYFTTNISLISDLKELVRIFYMPLIAMNGYMYLKEHPEKLPQIKKGIICNVFIIFLVIILGLITNTTVPTYAEGVGFRGWFYNSNSQSLILSFAVPFAFYYCFQSKKIWFKIFLTFMCFFLLYSNGTTGCYLMIIPTFGVAMLHTLYSKEETSYKIFEIAVLLIPLLGTIAFYNYSPDYEIGQISSESYSKTEENINGATSSIPGSTPKPDNEFKTEEDIIDHYFNEQFIADYGYSEIKKALGSNFDATHLVNNRFRKKLVAKVIFDHSSLPSKLFGFEFTKIDQYGADMENDYSSIMYYLGYVGLACYAAFTLYVFYVLIKKFIKNPKLFFDAEFLLIAGLYFVLNVGAEFSGSLLRRPNASIYMALLIMYILTKYKEENHE